MRNKPTSPEYTQKRSCGHCWQKPPSFRKSHKSPSRPAKRGQDTAAIRTSRRTIARIKKWRNRVPLFRHPEPALIPPRFFFLYEGFTVGYCILFISFLQQSFNQTHELTMLRFLFYGMWTVVWLLLWQWFFFLSNLKDIKRGIASLSSTTKPRL